MKPELIKKYNVAGPRYTSYPTVPCWDNSPSIVQWSQEVKKTFSVTNKTEGISLYVHLPFCESLCTYCGCNTRITVNHAVESPYIDAVLKEWQLYCNLFEEKPRIREIHLGGGTPTFFKPANLKKLIEKILENSDVCPDASFSIEGHPNSTSKEHLQVLYELGFRRISLGIQDFDPKVQKIINRIQTVETVEKVTSEARSTGFTSINYDLIYGLPLQTLESVKDTIEKVKALMPDRIAFYSYAHVPWIKPGQRKFTEKDLPADEEKRILYETGRKMLEDAGYVEIGMDHFALKTDDLYKAMTEKTLHRNFMGYTTISTKLLIGLGVSSISDSWTAFAQNVKTVEKYYECIANNEIPVFKGHLLTEEDLSIRKHILNLMCFDETSWNSDDAVQNEIMNNNLIEQLIEDKLIVLEKNAIHVTHEGRPYLRNVCMAIDARLNRMNEEKPLFSKVI